jgi:hypothetical protein
VLGRKEAMRLIWDGSHIPHGVQLWFGLWPGVQSSGEAVPEWVCGAPSTASRRASAIPFWLALLVQDVATRGKLPITHGSEDDLISLKERLFFDDVIYQRRAESTRQGSSHVRSFAMVTVMAYRQLTVSGWIWPPG